MHRREFIKTIAAAGVMTLIDPKNPLAGRAIASPGYFGLHQFIETHPNAVFIKRTNVAYKTDSAAKKLEGLELAREIFILRSTPDIPLSSKIGIKPNLAWSGGLADTEEGMGTTTDVHFVEGVIQGLKELGIQGDQVYLREAGFTEGENPLDLENCPYTPMAERTGAHFLDFPTGREINELTFDTLQEGTEVTWVDCPHGVVFRRIPYIAPFNQPDTWLLNIAKLKAHGMGMTLCVKNLQGTVVRPHLTFCEGVDTTKQHPEYIFQDFQPDLEEHIDALYAQHLEDGIPRWDRPGRFWQAGYAMETWAQRTCDSVSVLDIGLSIIEGICGRNGNFFEGPGPNGEAQDFMTNFLAFGKNPFLVDIIGFWLSGHEPGNFGLFHIARERGLCDVINPMSIPVYLWENGVPELTSLTEFERTPMVTLYLRRDYDGQEEPYWHMVDEHYSYEGDPCVLNLAEGWNMVSCPGAPVIDYIPTIVSGTSVSPYAYVWDPTTQQYKTTDKLEFGLGYWLYAGQATQLIIECRPCSILTCQLKGGWNMVGGVDANVDFSDPEDTPDNSVLLPAFIYDPESYSYKGRTEIYTRKGHWILALQDCSLNLSSVPLSPERKALVKTDQTIQPRWSMSIQLRTGETIHEAVLGVHPDAGDGFDPRMDVALPPDFGGMVDSPREANSVLSSLSFPVDDGPISRLSRYVRRPAEKIIWKMQAEGKDEGHGGFSPLELVWNASSVPDDKDMFLEMMGISIDMRKQSILKLPGGKHLFHVALKDRIPGESDLLQNYPNPCNPETWIPYQLSEDSPVTVRIYSVSGRLVRELNLGRKNAGIYQSRDMAAYWDGQNEAGEYAASGVYFYQIQAGRFSKTKKLIVMK